MLPVVPSTRRLVVPRTRPCAFSTSAPDALCAENKALPLPVVPRTRRLGPDVEEVLAVARHNETSCCRHNGKGLFDIRVKVQRLGPEVEEALAVVDRHEEVGEHLPRMHTPSEQQHSAHAVRTHAASTECTRRQNTRVHTPSERLTVVDRHEEVGEHLPRRENHYRIYDVGP